MNYYFIGLTVFFVTLGLTYLACKFFPRLGLMDHPEDYGLKRKPIPYFGGIVMFLSFTICAGLFLDFNRLFIGVFLGALLLILVNFFDDLYGLPPVFRLFIQILAALIVILAGLGIETVRIPWGGELILHQKRWQFWLFDHFFEITLIADLIVMIWIVLLTNTMNWLDGLPGLPSGISFIGFSVLFFLSIGSFNVVDQSQVATLSLILAMICLAFWIFDFAPAKILMGDTGSMFLGFMLACMAVFSGGKLTTTFLVLGFPILDLIWVVLRRIWYKKSPLKGDLFHFHHRLLKAGFSTRQSLGVYYLVCALFGVLALAAGAWQKMIIGLVLLFVMVAFGGYVVVKGRHA